MDVDEEWIQDEEEFILKQDEQWLHQENQGRLRLLFRNSRGGSAR